MKDTPKRREQEQRSYGPCHPTEPRRRLWVPKIRVRLARVPYAGGDIFCHHRERREIQRRGWSFGEGQGLSDFVGALDEVALYGSALPAAHVTAHFSAGAM
jgi:hypothetical protein